ncbi:MAG: hypothetical protein B6D53_00515, partial [Candidatus Omnitrophica bacterium 4484_49]
MFNKVYKSGVLIAFLILISRLFYLQVVKGAYFYDLSVNNYLRILPLPGFRGNILDRYGREIAGNKLSFCIQILPDKVKDKKSVFGMLSQDLGLDINALQ